MKRQKALRFVPCPKILGGTDSNSMLLPDLLKLNVSQEIQNTR